MQLVFFKMSLFHSSSSLVFSRPLLLSLSIMMMVTVFPTPSMKGSVLAFAPNPTNQFPKGITSSQTSPLSSVSLPLSLLSTHSKESTRRTMVILNENKKKGSSGSGGGAGGLVGYNNGALYEFHKRTQEEKISGYVGSSTYVNTDELWNLAWHDAFVRNDLSDFVPPLTDNLHVMIVGDENNNNNQGNNDMFGAGTENNLQELLPNTVDADGKIDADNNFDSDSNDGATTTSGDATKKPLPMPSYESIETTKTIDKTDATTSNPPLKAKDKKNTMAQTEKSSSSSSPSLLSSLMGMLNINNNQQKNDMNKNTVQSSAIEIKTYDCILDRGLLASLLAASPSSVSFLPDDYNAYNNNNGDGDGTIEYYTTTNKDININDNNDNINNINDDNKQAISQLLLEATKRIREHGVYILQSPPLDDSTKTYLTNIGDLLGLQWQFELDGISNDKVCVSVARKYFVGELPSFGKLAKISK